MNLMGARKNRLNKYIAAFNIAKINQKAYLLNFIGNLIYLPFNLLILYFVWFSIFKALDVTILNGFTLVELFMYYFIVKIINYSSNYFQQLPYLIWSDITEGKISKFLCRPINYLKYLFAYGSGYISYSWLVCIPLIFVGTIILGTSQKSIINISFFLIALLLSMVITYFINCIIGVTTFWTESIFGLRDFIINIEIFFSGKLVPLELMPDLVVKIGRFLPFNSIIHTPISIYLNKFTRNEIFFNIGIQLLWIVILYLILKVVWKKGLKRYEAQGG